jgi:type I restriction enzyme S subunit
MSVRAPVGDLNIAPCDMCIGRGLASLRAKNGNNIFLYYALKYNIKNLLRQGAATTFDSVNNDTINDLELIIPELELTRRLISEILFNFDSKIELNNRIIYEEESMIKTLYDYWFVQFDFPNTKGEPYKTSGGKMIWNDKLKREIPEGWKSLELSKVISRVATGLNPRTNFELGHGTNYYVTIANIDYGKITLDDKCDKIDDEALKIINHRSDLQVGDILFTSIEPVGITYLIQEKPKNWNINESVFTIRPNYDLSTAEYIYMLLSCDEIKAFTKNVSAGSIHKGVRIGILNTFQMAYSNKELISEFSKIVQPMLEQINILGKENQSLYELRDWLLPMLMNGQVKVE